VNLDPNLGMVERIAAALGPLRERVVFVGGSATDLLITDPLAAAIRVTKDVDVIVDGRPGIVEEIQRATPALRMYLREKLGGLLRDPIFIYAVEGHLPGDPGSQARVPDLLQRLRTIASGE